MASMLVDKEAVFSFSCSIVTASLKRFIRQPESMRRCKPGFSAQSSHHIQAVGWPSGCRSRAGCRRSWGRRAASWRSCWWDAAGWAPGRRGRCGRGGRNRTDRHKWQQSRRCPEKITPCSTKHMTFIHLDSKNENGLKDVAQRVHCSENQAGKVGHLSMQCKVKTGKEKKELRYQKGSSPKLQSQKSQGICNSCRYTSQYTPQKWPIRWIRQQLQTWDEGYTTNIEAILEKECPVPQGNVLGPHLVLLEVLEGDEDEGEAGDQEEDLAEEEQVQQVDGWLSQLKRGALSSRHHLKLENTLHLDYNLHFT